MLVYVKKDLFLTPDRFIAHGCNTLAKFGAGIALQIARKFPWAQESLQNYYEKQVIIHTTTLPLGAIYIAEPPNITEKSKYIVNCITQDGYGRNPEKRYVSYDAIDACMKAIKESAFFTTEKNISMPKIGAGLGGGHWPVIEEIINFRLRDFNVSVFLGERNESLSSSGS